MSVNFKAKVCERCGAQFGCGAKTDSACWCMNLNSAESIPKQYNDCLCENCLKIFTSKAIDNSNELIEGKDFYFEKGLMVFTSKYHLDRGLCCNSGCRHCPY